MEQEPYRRLLKLCAIVLAVGAILVTVCFYFIDRPVARRVHEEQTSRIDVLRWITLVPPVVQAWAPAVLAIVIVLRAFRPWSHFARALLAACVAIVLADQARESLAYLFGRYWPDTWINNNPSLIQNDAYGFHPFHSGSAYMSFPSGHMARTLAATTVLAVAWPRGRWPAIGISLLMAVSLVGMNYHFVGDCVAGSAVGIVFGLAAARVADVETLAIQRTVG